MTLRKTADSRGWSPGAIETSACGDGQAKAEKVKEKYTKKKHRARVCGDRPGSQGAKYLLSFSNVAKITSRRSYNIPEYVNLHLQSGGVATCLKQPRFYCVCCRIPISSRWNWNNFKPLCVTQLIFTLAQSQITARGMVIWVFWNIPRQLFLYIPFLGLN